MNENTRRITDGALMCSIIGVFLVLNRQTAMSLEFFSLVIVPFPIIIYTVKYGAKNALTVCACSVILTFILGSITTIIFVGAALVLGVVYGTGIKRNEPKAIILIKSTIIALALEMSVMFFLAVLFGINVAEQMEMYQAILSPLFTVDMETMKAIAFSFLVITTGLNAVIQVVLINVIATVILERMRLIKKTSMNIFAIKMGRISAIICAILVGLMIVSFTVELEGFAKATIIVSGMIALIILFVYGFIACLWLGLVYLKVNITIILTLLCILGSIVAVPLVVMLGFAYNMIDFKEITKALANKK